MAPTYPSKPIAPSSRATNPNPGGFASPKRSIVTVNTNDVVFVLLEDLEIAPTHAEADEQDLNPESFQNTFLTVQPPGSLESQAQECLVEAAELVMDGMIIINFLASIIPVVPDANIYAVAVGEDQRAGLLWDWEEELQKEEQRKR
ncbi:hypothetical protein EST38_g4595 [Candolleomyces aberdarensis]|uniref:Uncharacterized protein n=1 Tax=Candolleomyces aberdarensis TaxID=2316362 RepID=A0A4Q2DPG5_9AGAR|nr:hypothetical protein EST38_g4595 [Candolleomyces aberdarensis]